ncbi:MAG: hypothetical protein R2819_00705 [Allomuricauda sp.]
MRLFFFMICVLLVVSCNNENDIPVTVVELNITPSQELRHFLGNRPVEGGYSITKQAKSYSTSEILMDDELGGLAYVFIPEQDYQGIEIVEITLRTSIGNGDFTEYLTRLRIHVE